MYMYVMERTCCHISINLVLFQVLEVASQEMENVSWDSKWGGGGSQADSKF